MTGLDGLPIAIDPAAIDSAMQPFLVSEGEELRWRSAVARRLMTALLRLVTGSEAGRHRALVDQQYSAAWRRGYEHFRLGRTDLKAVPWHWRGRKLLLDTSGAARFRAILFAAVFDALKPGQVLEVGSGNGINLLGLSGAYPDIAFTGLELTAEGVEQARRAQSDDRVGEILRSYRPLETRDPTAPGRIRFVQGDASAMPFEDNSFDLVMTVLAVEQMESVRAAALAEIARVSRRHVLMIEPFRDANMRGLKRLYVRSRSYFEGWIDDLKDSGLHPVWATSDYPQEAFLGTAMVLAEKA